MFKFKSWVATLIVASLVASYVITHSEETVKTTIACKTPYQVETYKYSSEGAAFGSGMPGFWAEHKDNCKYIPLAALKGAKVLATDFKTSTLLNLIEIGEEKLWVKHAVFESNQP